MWVGPTASWVSDGPVASTLPSVRKVFSCWMTAVDGAAFGDTPVFEVRVAVVTGRVGCLIGPTGAGPFGGAR